MNRFFLAALISAQIGAQQEPFNFLDLPIDIQKHIVSYLPSARNSDLCEQLDHEQYIGLANGKHNETSRKDRKKYLFHGHKKPVFAVCEKNGKPVIKQIGALIENAKRSMLLGLSWADAAQPQTMICVYDGKKYVRTSFKKDSAFIQNIYGATISQKGDLAIIWHNTRNLMYYVTITHIDRVQKGKRIRLSKGALPLHSSKDMKDGLLNGFWLVGAALFDSMGSRLMVRMHKDVTKVCLLNGTCLLHHGFSSQDDHNIRNFTYIFDIPEQESKSANDILKRLRIAKNFFPEDKKKSSELIEN